MSIQDPGYRPDGWGTAGDHERRIRALEASLGVDPDCLCVPGGLTLEDVMREESLSGFWKLDESSGATAADSSGNGRDLTAGAASAPTWGQAAGPPGTQSAGWSSNSQQVSRASYPALGAGDFSVFGWVYLTSDAATDDHALMGAGQNLDGAGQLGWFLGVGGTMTGRGQKFFLGLGDSVFFDECLSNNTLSLNTWYFVGFVRSSGTFTIYVNGASQSDTSTQTIGTGSQTLYAGNNGGLSSTIYLRGRLSWWAIWDVALTPAQVLSLYTVGTNPGGAPEGYLIESDGSNAIRWIPGDEIALNDVTTGNASTSEHGWMRKLTGTVAQAFRGDGSFAAITDAELSTSDITTNDASTAKHGFLKKLSNVATQTINGVGNWVGFVGSIKKTGSAALTGDVTLTAGANMTLTQTGQDITFAATITGGGAVDSLNAAGDTPMTGALEIAAGTGIAVTQDDVDTITIAVTGGGLGASTLVYRYTVTGSDKASIDTGVDTADAGSNDWTNGDLLEVFMYLRVDEAVVPATVNVNFNNDTSAIYDRQRVRGANTTASAGIANSDTKIQVLASGASAVSGAFAPTEMKLPNFSGTVGSKSGNFISTVVDNTTGMIVDVWGFEYRSTSAITRLAITPATALKKFKVGSQLLIYKRLAS